jgi:hypothetical protein
MRTNCSLFFQRRRQELSKSRHISKDIINFVPSKEVKPKIDPAISKELEELRKFKQEVEAQLPGAYEGMVFVDILHKIKT